MYALEMAEQLEYLSDALLNVSRLTGNPTFTDEWLLELALNLAIIQLAHAELQEMAVPADMRDIHDQVLLATSDLASAADFMASGIDNFDVDDLETAAYLMGTGNDKLELATSMLNAYMAQFD